MLLDGFKILMMWFFGIVFLFLVKEIGMFFVSLWMGKVGLCF